MDLKKGDKFRHFKGKIVEILMVAKHSESLEDLVIYEHDGNIWARPIDMFLSEESVKNRIDNITGQEKRFEKVEDL